MSKICHNKITGLRKSHRPYFRRNIYSIAGVNIQNNEDLKRNLRDNNHNPWQQFKIAYQSIVDHPADIGIFLHAVDVMGDKHRYDPDINYLPMRALVEYAVLNYFHYNDLCTYGEIGDLICSIAENLIANYMESEEYDTAIGLFEHLLSEREAELNNHMLEILHHSSAAALEKSGRTRDAAQAIQKAIDRYHESWEDKLIKKLRALEGKQLIEKANL